MENTELTELQEVLENFKADIMDAFDNAPTVYKWENLLTYHDDIRMVVAVHLSKNKAHFCISLNNKLIDKNSPEFKCCTCFKKETK